MAFYRLEDLLHEMRKDADVAPQRLRRKKYFNVAYLVVDEVGFEPMSHKDASLFFRLVSYRYRRGCNGDHDQQERQGLAGHLRRRRGDDSRRSWIGCCTRAWCLNIRGRSYRLQDIEKLLK